MTLEVYRSTVQFPKEELYGLTSQFRRSCESIPANIAEACGRESGADMSRFFSIAMGSASELEYHLLLACDLHLIPVDQYEGLARQVVEVKRMLAGFMSKVRADR